MTATRTVSPFILSAVLVAQSTAPLSTPEPGEVMIVSIARDSSVTGGGISSSNYLPQGKVDVGPIAVFTPSGQWKQLSCYQMDSGGESPGCKDFDRDYLSKPHDYTVVSADGLGATVHVNRMHLDDECFGIYGNGTFSGAYIRDAAVAAESADMFTAGPPARRLPASEAEPVRKALAAAVGSKLDTTKYLRVYAVPLEGQSLLVIQRTYEDFANRPERKQNHLEPLDLVFAVGRMDQGHFKLLFWKENTEDENEQILGLIHLKSGRDFLLNDVSDPETSSSRVYGTHAGKFMLIFEGGGGGC